MAKRKLSRNILIVCEGTKTEPDYFRFIAKKISYPKNIWDVVEISDNTTLPNDIPIPAPTGLKVRKKRHFINPNKRKKGDRNALKELCDYLYGEGESIELYQTISAVPLRYVAQAQLIEKEQQLYEELWAVFDKDGHTHHKEAFKKAKETVYDKVVNIGFSSRSFEHWILLHFEKNKNTFHATECKNKDGDSLNCNATNGCKGTKCLCGYIRVRTPLSDYSKSSSPEDMNKMMEILLKPKTLNMAFENAAWLRGEIKKDPNTNTKEIFELNPYTDIDILVRNLIS